MKHELLALFGKPRTAVLDRARLPRFFRDYLDLTTACTDARPGLLLTAFLPFAAVNAGNRVYMYNNSARVYPNIWSCVIGPSGISRKTTALNYAGYCTRAFEEELAEGPLEAFNQRTQVITGATLSMLFTLLDQNPSRIIVQNEFSGWMEDMSKIYNRGYRQTLTDIFDGTSRNINTRERTDRVRKPALSIAAASTEGWFLKHLANSADRLSGFLQRMIFYVVRDIDYDQIRLEAGNVRELESALGEYDQRCFSWWRAIPGSHALEMDPAARELRDSVYKELHRATFAKRNDALMSYFTRLYDGYFYKFCILITLAENQRELAAAVRTGTCPRFFADTKVDAETAQQSLDLCAFYLKNTLPILDMLDEQAGLAGERKLITLLLDHFQGRAKHSELMNRAHMGKKEFMANMESLIEREAVSVGSYRSKQGNTGREYRVDPELLASWND